MNITLSLLTPYYWVGERNIWQNNILPISQAKKALNMSSLPLFLCLIAILLPERRGYWKSILVKISLHVIPFFCFSWFPKTKDNGAAVFPSLSSLFFLSVSRCIFSWRVRYRKEIVFPPPSARVVIPLPSSVPSVVRPPRIFRSTLWTCSLAAMQPSNNAVCRSAYTHFNRGLWVPCSRWNIYLPPCL